MKNTAIQFGKSLDADDFEATRKLLSPDCIYKIGEEVLTGPEAICRSYEKNMLEGRKKLDRLVWGDSRVERINEQQYYVHFTDYLTHRGKQHTFQCKQRLTINELGKIMLIEHMEDQAERKLLDKFYKQVGL